MSFAGRRNLTWQISANNNVRSISPKITSKHIYLIELINKQKQQLHKEIPSHLSDATYLVCELWSALFGGSVACFKLECLAKFKSARCAKAHFHQSCKAFKLSYLSHLNNRSKQKKKRVCVRLCMRSWLGSCTSWLMMRRLTTCLCQA